MGEKISARFNGENDEEAIKPQQQVPAVAQDINYGSSNTSPAMNEHIEV